MSDPNSTRPIGMCVRRHHGFHTVTPYLIVNHAAEALRFYRQAFGAMELMQPLAEPVSGKIVNAQIRIGDSPVMLSDEFPKWNQHGPSATTPVLLHLYVEDADAVFRRAISAGAREVIPVGDQFYGARSGRLVDPFGHVWIVETHLEDLSSQELRERYETSSRS